MANTKSLDLELSSSQYGYKTDTASLSITGDISIEAWVKLEQLASTAGSNFTIASKWDATNGKRSYMFNIPSGTDGLRFYATDDGGWNATHYVYYDSTTTLTAGVWYHVACTHDISGEACQFIINGSQESGNKTGSIGAAMHDNDSQFQVGAFEGGTFFDGKIDEVRLWNDVRTEAEVADNRLKEIAAGTSGLAAYYKFNDVSTDETANNNDLTLSGSPVYSTDVPFGVRGQPMMFSGGVAVG